MSDRYPGYDVLAKRDSPSWNAQTRTVVDARLAVQPDAHTFFSQAEWPSVCAICDRIIPQPPQASRRVPIAALLDAHLCNIASDGYRDARMPPMREAWRLGLRALDAESQRAHGHRFHELEVTQQSALLLVVQQGHTTDPAWQSLPPDLFFSKRVLHDITQLYYAHPYAWNQIGFGGPAAPRGYVRMDFDRRDPWEASEARPGREEEARRENARIG